MPLSSYPLPRSPRLEPCFALSGWNLVSQTYPRRLGSGQDNFESIGATYEYQECNEQPQADNELLGIRKHTLEMKWNLKKAGALALIQAEIERRTATRNPKAYAAGWAINAAVITGGVLLSEELGKTLADLVV